MSGKWRTLVLLALAELLAMGLWFSATAVVPALTAHWDLTAAQAAWLTMAVQLGFVVGALGSAVTNLPDIVEPRKVMAAGAAAGALLTVAIPLFHVGFPTATALRFGTGITLALVYPPGMKIMATWTREDRGLAIGLLVGALTVGSASPHLVRGLGGIAAWEPVLYAAAALALAGAAVAWRWGRTGPYATPAPAFHWRDMAHALRDRPLRLANLGYLGHMWELYAMWTWIPIFLLAAYRQSGEPGADAAQRLAAFGAFAAIAAGGLGAVAAGRLADRWGRCNTTIASMAVSGACAATIGLLLDHPVLATFMALVWGFAVVADSAQFSASVSELAQPEYMGTQLTTQTAMGFLLTIASIQLVPVSVDLVGWRWAFAMLAAGPLVGIVAMARLKRSPDAQRLAAGKG